MKKLLLSLALLVSTLTAWAWNGNSWMSEINGNIQMSNLSLPGSHNAATGHASSLGLVQDLNITAQFNDGIRAFDYRVHPSGSNLKMQHGITDCNISFQDAMALALQCVTNNPTETVFIQMQVENGDGSGDNTFWKLVAAALSGMDESKFIRWKSDLTLEECRGKVILQSRTKYGEFNGHGDTHWGWISWSGDNTNFVGRMYGADDEEVIVSDLYDHSGQTAKNAAITTYFNDIKKKRSNVWGICFVSGYNATIAITSSYVSNAAYTHPHTISLIDAMLNANDPKPIGSIMMDFAGMATHSSTTVRGDELVDKIIDLSIAYSNKYYPTTIPAHFVDYKPLLYIENTSAARENAFTTDVTPVTETEIGIGVRGYGGNGWQAIFCGRNATTSTTGISLYRNGDGHHLAFFPGDLGGDGDGFMDVWQDNNDIDIVAKVSELQVTMNGETQTKQTGKNTTYSTTRKLSFFANPEWDNAFRGRIYYFNIKDNDIDDHYVPAIRKDGQWGYWNQKTGDAERFVLPARGTYAGYNFKGNPNSTYITPQEAKTINVNEATTITLAGVVGKSLGSYTLTCENRNMQINGHNITAVVPGDYTVYINATDADGFAWQVPVAVTAIDESANQYSEVDYIYYDGVLTDNWNNKSYFDTRYVPNANTVVDVKTKIYDNSKGRWTVIFSGRTAFNNGMSLYQNDNGDEPQWGYFVSNNTNDNAGRLNRNTDYTVQFTKDALTVNGAQMATKSGITTANFVGSDQSITLFAGRNDWPLFGEISYFKITESGNVICELVPVISHDGQKFGFLNKVNNQIVTPNKYDGFHYGFKADSEKQYIAVAESEMEMFMSVSAQAPALNFHNLNAADYTLSYVTVDPDIASVNASGVVSGVNEGETQLIITAKKGSEVWSFKVNVKINPVPLSTLTELITEVESQTALLDLPYLSTTLQAANTVAAGTPTSQQIIDQLFALREAYTAAQAAERNIKNYVATRTLANNESVAIASAEVLFNAAQNNDQVFAALQELRYTRRRAHAERHTVEYTGSEPVDGGEYYLYNVGQRQFLTTGSDWGTHAALNYRGRAIKLHTSGAGFKVEMPSINEDNNRYMNNRGYMDTAGDVFKFIAVDGKENVYNVVQAADENRYMAWNPYANTNGTGNHTNYYGHESYPQDETTVGTEELGNREGNLDAQWILVTKETRDALLAQATKENPVDATYLIPNAAFNKKPGVNPWTYTGANYWGPDGRHTEFAVESYNSNSFEVSQSISLAPGKYKLTVSGFYRNGTDGQQQTNSADVKNAYLFATVEGTTTKAFLPNILEYANLAPGEGHNDPHYRNGEPIEYPCAVTSGLMWFRLGAYRTTIDIEVTGTAAKSVTLGVKKDNKDGVVGDDWTVFTNFTLSYEGPTADAIAIGSTGMATYCSPRNLDFSDSGLKAYVATEEKQSGDVRYIHLEEVTEAPAGTGLLLMAEAGTYYAPVVDAAQAVGTNYLVGTLAAGTVAASTNVVSNYVLAVRKSEGAEPAFYYVNSPAAIAANKAYLSITNGSLAKRLVIGIDNGDGTTSILGIDDEQQSAGDALYNVAGQKVNAAYKGIVIKNGNKVVVK